MITARADHGGGPEHLFQLCSRLVSTHNISIACPNDEPYAERFASIENLHKQIFIPHRSFTLLSFIKLVRFIWNENIVLIHSHGKGAGVFGRLLALITRRTSIHTFHGLHIGEYGAKSKRLYRLLERFFWRLSDVLIAVSTSEANEITQFLGVDPDKLTIIPNGVYIPEEVVANKKGPVLKVISVSRFDRQKNPEALVKVAKAIRKLNGNIEITVIGNGPLFKNTQREIIDENLSSILKLKGATENPRIAMRNAQVILSTSRWEGMPLALLEAMSEGLTVVASDVVGNKDIVEHGTHGYLFALDETDNAAQLLVALSENSVLLSELAENARKEAMRSYSIEAMVNRVAEVYKEAATRDAPHG